MKNRKSTAARKFLMKLVKAASACPDRNAGNRALAILLVLALKAAQERGILAGELR